MIYMKKKSDEGFVSIVVTMVVMVVISLITIGFARLMLREQRQSLDRQLSKQAYYAAESGVNDALLAISKDPNYSKVGCVSSVSLAGPVSATSVDKSIDGTNVESTCVEVKNAPTSLVFNPIGTNQNQPKVFKIDTQNQAGIAEKPIRIVIEWSAAASGSVSQFRPAGNTDLTSLSGWNSQTGLIKMTLVPYTSSNTRESLNANSFDVLLYPQTSSGSPSNITYSDADGSQKGKIAPAECIVLTKICRIMIDLASIPGGSYDSLTMALTSVYQANNVTITAVGATGTPLSFLGVQYVIDSTGKVADVLKRIQVRKPIQSDRIFPSGPLLARDDICKSVDKTVNIVTGAIEATTSCL